MSVVRAYEAHLLPAVTYNQQIIKHFLIVIITADVVYGRRKQIMYDKVNLLTIHFFKSFSLEMREAARTDPAGR